MTSGILNRHAEFPYSVGMSDDMDPFLRIETEISICLHRIDRNGGSRVSAAILQDLAAVVVIGKFTSLFTMTGSK